MSVPTAKTASRPRNRSHELHAVLGQSLRVLLTAAAYVLLQELRLHAARTAYARAQVSTLRERLLKIGARVVVSARRVVLHLPAAFADGHAWSLIARRLGVAT